MILASVGDLYANADLLLRNCLVIPHSTFWSQLWIGGEVEVVSAMGKQETVKPGGHTKKDTPKGAFSSKD